MSENSDVDQVDGPVDSQVDEVTTEDLAGETLVDRLARITAGQPGTGPATLHAQSSQQSLARHTDGGPAPSGDVHLPS